MNLVTSILIVIKMSEILNSGVITNYWTLTFDLFKTYETKVSSPIFSLLLSNSQITTHWKLWMTRKNIIPDYHKGYLTIQVENLNNFDITAQVNIAILNNQDQIHSEYAIPNHLFTTGEKWVSTEDILKISYYNVINGFESLLKDNKLKIKFEINLDHSQELPYIEENNFCRLEHFNKLEDLFMNKESSDIVIKADEKEFYVHKNILETFSPVFKAMFHHDFLEKTKNKVEIVDIEPKVLEEFLRFIYTGKVNDINEIEKELLYAAEKYSVKGLKILCEDNMSKKMSLEKAIEYLEVALKCNAVDLKNNAIKFINYHSKEMWKKKELQSLGRVCPDILFEIMNDYTETKE